MTHANNDTLEDLRGIHILYAGGTLLFIQAVHSNPTCPNAGLVTVVALQENGKRFKLLRHCDHSGFHHGGTNGQEVEATVKNQ